MVEDEVDMLEETLPEGGRGACGYFHRIWCSHSALTIGLRNVV